MGTETERKREAKAGTKQHGAITVDSPKADGVQSRCRMEEQRRRKRNKKREAPTSVCVGLMPLVNPNVVDDGSIRRAHVLPSDGSGVGHTELAVAIVAVDDLCGVGEWCNAGRQT
jgi:hypothetical protein